MVNHATKSIQRHLEQLKETIPAPTEAQNELWHRIEQDLERLAKTEQDQFVAETTALYNGSQEIANAWSERQINEALIKQLRLKDPCEVAIFKIVSIDGEPFWAELRAVWQKKDNPTYRVGTKIFLPDPTETQIFSKPEPLFIEDIEGDSALSAADRDYFEPTAARSAAILPLNFLGQKTGVVIIYFTDAYQFRENTKRFWLALTDHAGLALSNRQLLQEATYRVIQMETAGEVARAASTLLDLQALLKSAVALIRDRFELYYVGAYLIDPKTESAILRAGTGEAGRRLLAEKQRLKIDTDSMIGQSIKRKRPQISLDIGKEAVTFHNPHLPETRSEMTLPLVYRNQSIGALTLQSKEPAAFSKEDIIFMQMMTDQLATAIENARLFEKAQKEIGERKRVEEALVTWTTELEKATSFLDSIVENLPSGLFIKDAENLRYVRINKVQEKWLGRSREDLIGKTDQDFMADKKAKQLTRQDRQVLDQSQLLDIPEETIQDKDGETRILHTKKVPILGPDGQPEYLLGISEDITERKKAQQALAKRERYLAAQLEIQNELLATRKPVPPYATILATLGQVSGASRVYVFENHRDENNQLLTSQKAEWCNQGIEPEIDNPELQNLALEELMPRWVAKLSTGEFISGSVSDFPEAEREILEPQNIQAILVLPLTVGEQFFGFVGFDNCVDDRPWDALEQGLLSTAAASVSLWHERRQAEDNLLKVLKRTESLYKIGNIITTATEQRPTFEVVLVEYVRLLDIKPGYGSIILFEHKKGYSKVQALCIDGNIVESTLSFPVSQDRVGQHLIEKRSLLMVEDVYQHPLTKDSPEFWQQEQTVRALLFVPLIVGKQVVGSVVAGATKSDLLFSTRSQETGQIITDQLAIWLENRQLLTEAQYRSSQLQTAAEVSRAASSILDIDTLMDTSVNLIRDRFGFYYVGMFMVDESGEWAELRAGTGKAGRIQLAKNHRLKIGNESMIGWSIANRNARIVLDVGQEAIHFQNPILPDTRSEMALPLISRDEVIGALTVQSIERGAFSDEDVTLLQTMADQLANALANAQLFETVTRSRKEAESRLRETQALQKLSQNLATTLETDAILNIFFSACTTEIGFEYVQVSLVDKEQNRVRAIGGIGVSENHLQQSSQPLDSTDIMADIVRTGKTEILSGWDDRFDRDLFEAEDHAGWIRLFTPITLRRENIGLVEAGYNRSHSTPILQAQIRLLKVFISQTALALENAQRYEASRQAARREALIKEITTKVRASTDLDTILQTTLKEVSGAINNKRAFIQLIPPQTNGSGSMKEGPPAPGSSPAPAPQGEASHE